MSERTFLNASAADRSAAWREAGLLLLVSVLATVGWWFLNPEHLPLRADPQVYELELAAPLVTVTEAAALYEAGLHLFVDTRSMTDGLTIPGSLFIREATFDDDLLDNFDFLLPEDQLILFGDGNLTRTSNVAGRLLERGYPNLLILSGGLAGWQAAGGPVSTTDEGATP